MTMFQRYYNNLHMTLKKQHHGEFETFDGSEVSFLACHNHLCPDEEKGCSARDFVIFESCRAENLLSNDIKYVMIG